MKLYSYQPPTDYKFDTLESGQIWLSYPDQLNDVFEFINPYDFIKQLGLDNLVDFLNAYKAMPKQDKTLHNPNELNRLVDFLMHVIQTEKNNPHRPSGAKGIGVPAIESAFRVGINALHQSVGVMCFSNSYVNQLMWAYYAQGHAGFCVGFDVDFDALAEEEIHAQNVNYSRSRPRIDVLQVLFTDFIQKVVFTKSLDWAHENELRIAVNKNTQIELAALVGNADSPYGFKINQPKGLTVSEIILGSKISPIHKSRLELIASTLSRRQGNNIKILKLEPCAEHYELISKTL